MRRVALLVVVAAVVVAVAALAYTYTLLRGAQRPTGLPEPIADVLRGVQRSITVRVAGAVDGHVPRIYTCDARPWRPPLIEWSPVNGSAYAVLVVDPDAPNGLFVHLVAYDGREPRWPAPDYHVGYNSAGRLGWFPVCPPAGDKPHHYYFIVVALRKPTGLPSGASFNQVLSAIAGNAVAYGYTVLTYQR